MVKRDGSTDKRFRPRSAEDEHPTMIRTYLEFALAEGKADEFVAFFDRQAILTNAVDQEGCLGAELTLSDDGSTALVTALWDDAAAYDRWTSRSDRSDISAELNTFLRERLGPATVGRAYRVALTGDGRSPAEPVAEIGDNGG